VVVIVVSFRAVTPAGMLVSSCRVCAGRRRAAIPQVWYV
jgi:hypothetical protein